MSALQNFQTVSGMASCQWYLVAPSGFFIRAMARLVLEKHADSIAKAVEAGQTISDVLPSLPEPQARILEEMHRFGVP